MMSSCDWAAPPSCWTSLHNGALSPPGPQRQQQQRDGTPGLLITATAEGHALARDGGRAGGDVRACPCSYTLAVMRSDDGTGWVRVMCDAPTCRALAEGRPVVGESWPVDWARDLRAPSTLTGCARNYCPEHAGLAVSARSAERCLAIVACERPCCSRRSR